MENSSSQPRESFPSEKAQGNVIMLKQSQEKLSSSSVKENQIRKLKRTETLHLRYTTVYLDRNKILSQMFTSNLLSFKSIEFLCIRDNFLKSLGFLEDLPNLWYLDIRNNQIDSYEIFKVKTTFGFLGVSPGKYIINQFLALTKLMIGIFQIDGDFDNEIRNRITSFINRSPNNILMANGEIVLFDSENIVKLGKENSEANLNLIQGESTHKISQSPRRLSIVKVDNKKFSLNFGYASDFRNSIVKGYYSPSISLGKNSMINNEIQIFHLNPKTRELVRFFNEIYKPQIVEDVKIITSEYYEIERQKIVYVFEIFKSFHCLHDCSKNKIFNLREEKLENKNVDFEIFALAFSSDTTIQCIILEILLSYLLGILQKDMVYKLYMLLYKNLIRYHNMQKFKKCLTFILAMEHPLILGYYFFLYDHLVRLLAEKQQNNINHLHTNTYADDPSSPDEIKTLLNMKSLVPHVNNLKSQQKENLKVYAQSEFPFQVRKNLIKTVLINHLDKTLNILPQVLKLTQHLHDFLLINKFDAELIKTVADSYKIFHGIRASFFTYLNQFGNRIFPSKAERVLNNHMISHLSNELYFMNDANTLLERKKLNRFGGDGSQGGRSIGNNGSNYYKKALSHLLKYPLVLQKSKLKFKEIIIQKQKIDQKIKSNDESLLELNSPLKVISKNSIMSFNVNFLERIAQQRMGKSLFKPKFISSQLFKHQKKSMYRNVNTSHNVTRHHGMLNETGGIFLTTSSSVAPYEGNTSLNNNCIPSANTTAYCLTSANFEQNAMTKFALKTESASHVYLNTLSMELSPIRKKGT